MIRAAATTRASRTGTLSSGSSRLEELGQRDREPGQDVLSLEYGRLAQEARRAVRLQRSNARIRLKEDEVVRLYDVTRRTLSEWTERLRRETGGGFAAELTAKDSTEKGRNPSGELLQVNSSDVADG